MNNLNQLLIQTQRAQSKNLLIKIIYDVTNDRRPEMYIN